MVWKAQRHEPGRTKRDSAQKYKQTDLEKDCKVLVPLQMATKTGRFCDETQKSNFLCVVCSSEMVQVRTNLVTDSPNCEENHGGDHPELHVLCCFISGKRFPYMDIVTTAKRWKAEEVDFSAGERLLQVDGVNGRKKQNPNMSAAFLETGLRSWKL